jgi:hypothetical protein
MSSFESDSYYPNHADVREAPTNYRRNTWEQVKAADNLNYYFLNSDYSDEYYSDDEYSRDPDVDYADITCYQPGTSTRSACASGAFHPGISPQPWQCQPNSSSGKSLVKPNPQNRSYPKPRKARKRHKKKRPKPSPPSPPVTGALCAQIKEMQLPDHPPIPLTMECSYDHKKRPNQGSPPTRRKISVLRDSSIHRPPTLPPHHGELLPLVCRTRMSHTQPRLHGHQMSRKLVQRPKPPSVLNLNQTQTPATRTTLIVQMYQIQHPPTPTRGYPLRRVFTQSKHAIKHQWGISM